MSTNTTDPDQGSDVKLVPVHKDDFKKINEFAEAAWICRDPENIENIKETRRNLLREVNTEYWHHFLVFNICSNIYIAAQYSDNRGYSEESRGQRGGYEIIVIIV